MSVADASPLVPSSGLDAFPEFDLCCLFDDPDDPSELTVFPAAGADVTTTWLTVDAGHAVPIEDAR